MPSLLLARIMFFFVGGAGHKTKSSSVQSAISKGKSALYFGNDTLSQLNSSCMT